MKRAAQTRDYPFFSAVTKYLDYMKHLEKHISLHLHHHQRSVHTEDNSLLPSAVNIYAEVTGVVNSGFNTSARPNAYQSDTTGLTPQLFLAQFLKTLYIYNHAPCTAFCPIMYMISIQPCTLAVLGTTCQLQPQLSRGDRVKKTSKILHSQKYYENCWLGRDERLSQIRLQSNSSEGRKQKEMCQHSTDIQQFIKIQEIFGSVFRTVTSLFYIFISIFMCILFLSFPGLLQQLDSCMNCLPLPV